MKKLSAAVLVWSLVLALTACGTPFVNQDMMEPEPAYEYIHIYYVSDNGAMESERLYLPCIVQTIFDEWAARNGIDAVSVLETRREDNAQTIDPDDPGGTPGVITHIAADHAVLYITLSAEFETYSDGADGQLIVESLQQTFLDHHDYDEVQILIGP